MLKLLAVASIHIIGDWGRRGQFSQRDVARKMHATPADAVISVGDNFYPDGLANADDPQVQESWLDVYAPDKPWFVALGNHDHHGNITAQMHIDHTHWHMPAAVYSFELGEHSFVVADSEKIDGEQFKHIDRLLSEKSGFKWIVAHHPIVTAGWHHHVDFDYQSEMAHLYYKHNVTGIISGHDHNMQYLEWRGIRQIISGGGASTYYVEYPQEGLKYFDASPGFVNLRLKDRKIDFWNTDEIKYTVSF